VATALANLKFLSDLRQRLPDMKVVMIEMEENEATFLKAVRAGVSGYLLKDASAMDVLSAIRAVLQGEAVCPPRLCLTLCKTVKQEARASVNLTLTVNLGLTRREQELIPLIGEGLTNKEIAFR